jgi:hypothetical protein
VPRPRSAIRNLVMTLATTPEPGEFELVDCFEGRRQARPDESATAGTSRQAGIGQGWVLRRPPRVGAWPIRWNPCAPDIRRSTSGFCV